MLYNNENPCLEVSETALERCYILGDVIALTKLHYTACASLQGRLEVDDSLA